MSTPDIATNAGLQRISWACLQHWNGQPVPLDARSICYTWIKRVYQAQFGDTFSPQKLAVLARLGILTKDDISRGGNRRYYRVTDAVALNALLLRLSFIAVY